jgi:hypothetical protein
MDPNERISDRNFFEFHSKRIDLTAIVNTDGAASSDKQFEIAKAMPFVWSATAIFLNCARLPIKRQAFESNDGFSEWFTIVTTCWMILELKA